MPRCHVYGGDRGGDGRASTRNALVTSIMVFVVPEPPAHRVRTYMPSKLIHSSKRKAHATTSVVVADKIKSTCDQPGMFGIHKTQSICRQFCISVNQPNLKRLRPRTWVGDTESQHKRRCVRDAYEPPHTYVLKPMLGRQGDVLMFLYFRYARFTNTE